MTRHSSVTVRSSWSRIPPPNAPGAVPFNSTRTSTVTFSFGSTRIRSRCIRCLPKVSHCTSRTTAVSRWPSQSTSTTRLPACRIVRTCGAGTVNGTGSCLWPYMFPGTSPCSRNRMQARVPCSFRFLTANFPITDMTNHLLEGPDPARAGELDGVPFVRGTGTHRNPPGRVCRENAKRARYRLGPIAARNPQRGPLLPPDPHPDSGCIRVFHYMCLVDWFLKTVVNYSGCSDFAAP